MRAHKGQETNEPEPEDAKELFGGKEEALWGTESEGCRGDEMWLFLVKLLHSSRE